MFLDTVDFSYAPAYWISSMTLVVLSFRIFGTDKGYRKLKALKSADHNYEYVEEKVAKIN